MKQFSFCLFWILSIQLMAQDIIIKKNGDEVNAQVTEIGTDEIKFKKFENINGPTYSLPKSELFMIKYSNGTKEVFNSNTSTPVQAPTPVPTPSTTWSTSNEPTNPYGTTSTTETQPKIKSKIEGDGWRYYYDGRYLSEISFIKVLKDAQVNDGLKELEEGRKMKNTGKALTGAAIPFMILGPILTGIGALVITSYNAKVDTYNNANYYSYPAVPNREEYNTGNTMMGVGYGMFGFGVASLTTGIVLKSASKKKYKKAAELYNAKL